ncbi:MAG TPA: PilZ domain-containing protein [Bryobacteraceae bacterium]|nr:PilZ domain-containing protein [Bryobacteraceae bacterium]
MTTLQTEPILSETILSEHRRSLIGQINDRRVFPRYPIPNKLAVSLRILPATDVIPAQIHDLSRDGVGLMTNVFIAPGESVTFPVGSDWVVAEVRHCNPSTAGYVVGAMITDIVGVTEAA